MISLRRKRERKQFEVNLYNACHALMYYPKRGTYDWCEGEVPGTPDRLATVGSKAFDIGPISSTLQCNSVMKR